jgi:molybdate transport system permease protein
VAALDLFPLWLSLRVAAVATLFVVPLGLALALLQARRRYPGRSLVDAAVLLPLVLPPSVMGLLFFLVLGRRSALGRFLDQTFDVQVAFTPTAAILASAVAAFPIMVKTAQPALESVPHELEQAGRSLGLSPAALFFRVTLPFAWRGVVAAAVLAFARAIGELGATLMFAGMIDGLTNTLPLEIYKLYQQGRDGTALHYALIMVASSIAIALVATSLTRERRTA